MELERPTAVTLGDENWYEIWVYLGNIWEIKSIEIDILYKEEEFIKSESPNFLF